MVIFERLRTEPVYNTRAVARMTGVPADTFRAWERRYGMPRPSRTEGNHRLYSERDIATIKWLRERTSLGQSISQAVALFRLEAERPPDGIAEKPTDNGDARRPDAAATDDRLGPFRDEMVEALLAFDPARADRVVEEVVAMLTVEEVCLRVFQDVLTEIGERWHRGEVGISAEHFASAYVLRKLGALFNLSQPDIGRGPIVGACVEGELHEVGLLLNCLFLSRRGYRVVYLGANLPLPDLIEAVTNIRPALVLLSATTHRAAEHLTIAARELVSRRPEDGLVAPPIVGYGGRIFSIEPTSRRIVDGVFLGRDANEAVATVEALLSPQAIAPRPLPPS